MPLSSSHSSDSSYRAKAMAAQPTALPIETKFLQPGQNAPLNMDASPSKGSRRALKVTVLDCVNVKPPKELYPIDSPQLTLGLGKASISTGFGRTSLTDSTILFDDGMRVLPFNGEEYLRFMLTSKGMYQLGYGDASISDNTIYDRWEGPVVLYGKGLVPCGVIRVLIEKTGDRVEPELTTGTPIASGTGGTTSTVGGGSVAPKPLPAAVDDSSTEDSDLESLGPIRVKTDCKSIRINLIDGRGMICGKTDHAKNPYVVFKLGKDKLRTLPVYASSDHVYFNQVLQFPYKGSRGLKITAKDDKKMKLDPKIGNTVVDLEKYMTSTEPDHRVQIPLTLKGKHNGDLNCIVQLSSKPVTGATVVSTRDELESLGGSSVGSSGSRLSHGHKPICNTIRIDGVTCDESIENYPFVKVKIGKKELRADVREKVSGTSTTFKDQMFIPYTGEKSMKITLQHDKTMQRDPVIGTGKLDLTQYAIREVHEEVEVPIYDKDGKRVSRVIMMLRSDLERIEKAKCIKPEQQKQVERTMMKSTLSTPPCKYFKLRPVSITSVKSDENPYIVSTFGKRSTRSKTHKEKDGQTVHCTEEFIYPYEPYRDMKLELYDDQKFKQDPVLGTAHVNMDELIVRGQKKDVEVVMGEKKVKFLCEECDKEGGALNIKKPICQPASEVVPGGLYKSFELLVEFADDLVDPKPDDKDIIDPFIKVDHGASSLKGKQKKDAGINPIFMDTFKMPIKPGQDIDVSVYDKEGITKSDVLVGSGTFRLPELTVRYHPRQTVLELYKEGDFVGRLFLRFKLLETELKKPEYVASTESFVGKDPLDFSLFENTPLYPSFIVRLVAAKNLRRSGKVDKGIDVYGKLSNGQSLVETSVHKNCGPDCAFGDTYIFPTRNNRFLRCNMMDDDLGKDTLLGAGKVDLEDVVCEIGKIVKSKVALKDMKGKPAGELYVELVPSNEKPEKAGKYIGSSLDQFAESSAPKVFADTIQITGSSAALQTSQVKSLYESMEVEAVKIQNVLNPNPAGQRLDLQISTIFGDVKLSGKEHESVEKSQVIQFSDIFHFPYRPYQHLKIEARDQNDALIGTTKINLDSFVTQATNQQRLKVTLQRPSDNTPAGVLFLKLKFYEKSHTNEPKVEWK